MCFVPQYRVKDVLEEPAFRSWEGGFWEWFTQEEVKMEYREMRASRTPKAMRLTALGGGLIQA